MIGNPGGGRHRSDQPGIDIPGLDARLEDLNVVQPRDDEVHGSARFDRRDVRRQQVDVLRRRG
jgi:hypothetical protein